MNTIKYVLTEKAYWSDRQFFEYASTRKGLESLGLKPGEVNCEVLIISEHGLMFSLTPSKDKDGFCGTSGSGWPHPEKSVNRIYRTSVKNISEATKYLQRVLTLNIEYGSQSRAIVNIDHEKDFKKVAEALGMQPEKISERLF